MRNFEFVKVANLHKHNVISELTIFNLSFILYLFNKSFNYVRVLVRSYSRKEKQDILTHLRCKVVLLYCDKWFNLIYEWLICNLPDPKWYQSPYEIIKIDLFIDFTFIFFKVSYCRYQCLFQSLRPECIWNIWWSIRIAHKHR